MAAEAARSPTSSKEEVPLREVLGGAPLAAVPDRADLESEDVARRARALIRAHFTDPEACRTSAIARTLDISPSYLCRRYRQAFGRTIGQEVRRLRVRLALRLLADSDLLIKEIAAEVGYLRATYRTFLSAFRKETGMPPTDYRRRARRASGNGRQG